MRLFVSFLKKWLSRFLFRPNRNRFFKKKIIFVINIATEYAMKRLLFIVFSVVFATLCLRAQTLEDARNMYRAGLYAEALPVFEKNLKKKPKSPTLNQWYGVCLYETGRRAEAEKYLKIAANGKIPESYRYLAGICFEQYRFVDAVNYFSRYIGYLNDRKESKEDMDDYELLATQAELGAQMLSKVQVVQVIDSMVVDKDDFFLHYKLSSEVGSLHDYHSLTGDDRPGASPVFQTQRRDKILYAVPTEDAGYELVTRIRLGDDTYSEEESIDDLNTMYDDSYPFLLTDGVTFYFASNEEDRTLGGYDIFVTKYNINTDEYSDPEQLPMPFNSPYNDYMMAIDEVNHVGWFASDRYQPEGKVCIYIFLYEKTPEFYFPEDRSLRLRQLARLVSIRETWKDGVDYKPVLEKIRNMQPAEKKTLAKNAIAFVVTDRIVYTTLSQFKSKEARDLFVKSQELRRVISANETELDRLRKEYSAGKNLSATAGRIQELEKLLMTLYPQPEDYEKQSREAELSFLQKK